MYLSTSLHLYDVTEDQFIKQRLTSYSLISKFGSTILHDNLDIEELILYRLIFASILF